MGWEFKNPADVLTFVNDCKSAASNVRGELSRRVGTDMCMYEGVQWLNETNIAQRGNYTIDRFSRDINPDSNRIRVTANRTARFVQKVAAATFLDILAVEAFPPEGSYSPESLLAAQIGERTASAVAEASGYVRAARDANHLRCICGTAGIGLHINVVPRTLDMGGQTRYTNDQVITSFMFQPHQLTLDPYNAECDLECHDRVIYSDVMTAKKIERVYGVKLDENELQTIAQLTPVEQQFNTLSQNRLFSKYKMYSQSKGAIVHQIHLKTPDGRHGLMYLAIEVPNAKEPLVPNFENAESPFGGDGLPLTLLHGHRRADSMWSIGDATMLKDDQDRLNLIQTFLFRQIQKNAGWQWLVPDEALKPEHDGQFSNTVAGVIKYKSGTRDRPVNAPQLIQYPPPQPMLSDMSGIAEASMREQSHRAEGSFGQTKCVDGNAKVLMASGERKLMRDIVAGDEVVALKDGRFVHERVAWHTASGTKACLKIECDRGYTVTASPEHRILTDTGWKVAGDVAEGDYLLAAKRFAMPRREFCQKTCDDAVVAAVWLAEGDKARMDAYAITNGLDEVRNELIAISGRRGWDHRVDRWLRIRLLKNGQPEGPNDLLKRIGVRAMRTGTIRVPEFVMTGSYETITAFIRYLWACDGCAAIGRTGKGRCTLTYTSNSRAMLDDLRALLLRFGIRSGINRCLATWTLVVGEQCSIAIFNEHIGIVGKDEALRTVVESAAARERGSNNYCLPGWTKEHVAHGSKWYTKRLGRFFSTSNPGGLAEGHAAVVCEMEDAPVIRAMLESDVEYVRFRRAVPVENVETFDMEVGESHNFLADGLVVHNSHVPDSTFQRALDEADQVLGIRVREDMSRHERLLSVMSGTAIKLAQAGSPSVLQSLRKAGFGTDEFAVIASTDPYCPGYSLKMRESSIRYRPLSRRRADLDAALTAQAVTAMEYRMELASGQDQPITQTDGMYIYEAQKAAMNIVAGMEWDPVPVGVYAEVFVGEFRKAMFSDQAKLDPAVRKRLSDAIIRQQSLAAQEAMIAQAGTGEVAGGPQQVDPEQQNVESLLARIDGQVGAGAVPSQPNQSAA